MRLLGGCLVLICSVFACADAGPDLDSGTAPQIWCRGLCGAERRCSIAPGACEEDCVGRRPGLAHFSQDGARALRPCLERLSCPAVRGEEALWDAEMDACWEGARKTVDVSSHARTFCTKYVEAWFECGAFWAVSECERSLSMWTDAVISRLEPCLEQPSCEAMRACDESTWSTL